MVTKEFKEAYKKLNPKQKEAVDNIEGPVMVIAGPGTGKTTILTLRIANILLKTDTPPSGILALTFTESGAKAMRAKLREIIGNAALEVPIHTFHSFAASVITEYQDHFPHLFRFQQITDIESEMILRDILRQKKFAKLRPIGEPDFYVPKILAAISNSKQEAWMPEMLRSFAKEEAERVKNDQFSISSRGASKGKLKADALKHIEKCGRTILFADVYEAYESKKREGRKIDFDDLIFELLKTLREDKLLLQILQEKFLYILLDEHQDTNDSQNLIVRAIADFFDTPNLFVVGDEKQAIYRFQGASVENFLSFQKIWSKMRVVSLEDNYRSQQDILNASFKMIEQNYTEKEHQNLRVKLKSNRIETGPLDLVFAPNTETEEAYLVNKLRELVKKEKNETIAVIVRRNSDVSKILSLLEMNGIEASAERGANVFADPVGRLFFSLLEFLTDPSRTEALAETFAGGLWGLNFAEQIGLIKLAKSGDWKEVEKRVRALPRLQKEINRSGAIGYLALAADLSGFAKMAGESPLAAEVWRAIFELAKNLTRANHIEDPRELMEALLAYKKSAERKIVKIKIGEVSAQIAVMTAHSSKGLEFDYIFLPYAVEESWVRKNRGSYFVLPKEREKNDDVRDERRLFYVALTRARKHISISFSLEDELGRILTPVRFLDELDAAHTSRTNLTAVKKPVTMRNIEKMEARQNNEKIEYAKRVLLENGLSVTALNHFLNCPSEFFYKSILKLPEPPSASSEKGTAMHEALSKVWKDLIPLKMKNGILREANITKIITSVVQDYFKHSLLPKFEKETILEELLSNAPKVASALLDHFSQNGKVSTETWIENDFNFGKTKKEKIGLKLHGKLDVLLEKENEIFVYDYKTAEAKSINFIKGEVKSADRRDSGNYFRQLVFYKMLLENNFRFAGKKIEPALIFVKPDRKGRCPTVTLPIEKSDMEKVQSEIKTLIESVWSGKFLAASCSNQDCKYCGYKKFGR